MADDTIIAVQENAPVHPLQRNWLSGPKGAYEVKKVGDEMYIRADMPGVQAENVKVKKDAGNLIRFQAITSKPLLNCKMDSPLRFYLGYIMVECADFNQVHYDTFVNNGVFRIVVKGVTAASLHIRKPTGPVKQPINAPDYHLRPGSALTVEGMQMTIDHEYDCPCCQGRTTDHIYNGPWSENMGCINPFVISGMEGSFQTKFSPLPDGSGDQYMYFRLDMPDCFPDYHMKDIRETFVVVIGLTPPDVPVFRLDEPGGRRFFCLIKLQCDCCFFDTKFPFDFSALEDGVLRMFLKVGRKTNVFKDDEGGMSYRVPSCEPPAEASTSSSTKTSAAARRGGRRGGDRGRNRTESDANITWHAKRDARTL